MIDRHDETRGFNNLTSEKSAKQIILIRTVAGAGSTYFINQKCGNKLIVFEKETNESFCLRLFLNILKEYKKELKDYLNNLEKNYTLVSPNINWGLSNEKLAESFSKYYSERTLFEYERLNLSDNYLKFSIPAIIQKDFKELFFNFITKLNKIYIIYDKFDELIDSYEISDFIGNVNKIHIIVTQNPNLYNKYKHNYLEILNFNDSQYYEEFLSQRISLRSQNRLTALAQDLFYVLNGSPKNLDIVISQCKSDLANCEDEEKITDIIKARCKDFIKEKHTILTNSIIRILYFADEAGLSVIKSLYREISFTDEFFDKQCHDLILHENIIENWTKISLSQRTRIAFKWDIMSTPEKRLHESNSFLAIVNKYLDKHRMTTDIQKMIINAIKTIYDAKRYLPVCYINTVIDYAKSLYDDMRFADAAYYFSIIPDLHNYVESSKIYDIAKLLYKSGYYAQCACFLEKIKFSDLCDKEQSDAYLILANCNMMQDNIKSIEYYDKVIEFNDHNILLAIGGKLMAKSETKGLTTELITDYRNIISEYSEMPNTEGYLSLLRNALDFEKNSEALKIMHKGLEYALEFNNEKEVFKIKQNIALNLIKADKLNDAEKYLLDVKEYCYLFNKKEMSYPLINLAVIEIYRYFETGKYEYAAKAHNYAMQALDYATSYYAVTLSNIHYLTAMSILKTERENKYNISDERIKSLRKYFLQSTREDTRIDNRVAIKRYLALISSARITGDINEAKEYLRELCNKHSNKFGKHVNKINKIIKEMQITDLPSYQNDEIDDSCIDYALETRFEPWLISLTHL